MFLSYVLSFIYVGIYWNNHHHMLQAAQHVSGGILWANLHLLFWLSLLPFGTAWMGENHFEALPVALYGGLLLMCAIAYTILSRALIARHGPESALARAVGRDGKGLASLAIYACAVPLAFVNPRFVPRCTCSSRRIWLVPDRRIERNLARSPDQARRPPPGPGPRLRLAKPQRLQHRDGVGADGDRRAPDLRPAWR